MIGAYAEEAFFHRSPGSITGLYGMKAKRTVMRLIKEGWVQFVASDTHSDNNRNPDLENAAARIEKKFG